MRPQPATRLNVLLTQDRPHAGEHWTQQLPRLLAPFGVAAYVVGSAQDAVELARRLEIHAAVVDLGTPMGRVAGGLQTLPRPVVPPQVHSPAGVWLIELLRRLPSRPPVVVLRAPMPGQREVNRSLHEALRLGAFSVLDKPVEMEQVLDVFRRLIDRQYGGAWPDAAARGTRGQPQPPRPRRPPRWRGTSS